MVPTILAKLKRDHPKMEAKCTLNGRLSANNVCVYAWVRVFTTEYLFESEDARQKDSAGNEQLV